MATLHLGPCDVTFDPAGANVNITCEGGVDITLGDAVADLHTDATGTGACDAVITGANVGVKINMADYDLDKFASVFPNATQIGSGATSRVEIRTKVGTSLLSLAKMLLIKKYVNGSVSASTKDWITVVKAYPSGEVAFSFKKDAQTVFPLSFKCFPDTSASNRVLYFGDSAAS